MTGSGLERNPQFAGEFLGGPPRSNQLQDLSFAFREAFDHNASGLGTTLSHVNADEKDNTTG
jgi:hypothetical protein